MWKGHGKRMSHYAPNTSYIKVKLNPKFCSSIDEIIALPTVCSGLISSARHYKVLT